MTTLDDVTARFTAAASLEVCHREAACPSLAGVLAALRALRKGQAAGVSGALDALLETAHRWTRVITAAPLAFDNRHVRTGQVHDGVLAHIKSGRDSHLDDALAQLEGHLRALLTEPQHPGSAPLDGALSLYESSYLLRGRDDEPLLRAWLAEQDPCDVLLVTPEVLRGARVREGLLLLGPPERYFRSPWCLPDSARRRAGWLLTAPPATHVSVLTWPGHARFDLAGAALLPNATHPPITQQHSVVAASGPSFAVDDIWRPERLAVHVMPVRDAGDREPVEARAVVLADGSYVFYNEGGLPRPHIVSWDAGTLEVSLGDVRRLVPGMVLSVRPPYLSGHDDLARRADVLLADKYGLDHVHRARAAKQELKDAFAAAKRVNGEPILQQRFARAVRDEAYARHVFADLPSPDYIGPEKAGALEALCRTLGVVDESGTRRRLLADLRSAQRRAGADITAELVELLRVDQTWHEKLETAGRAAVRSASGNELVLAAVVSVSEETYTVSRSRLGRLVAGGRASNGSSAP